jgi:hypothetical protein
MSDAERLARRMHECFNELYRTRGWGPDDVVPWDESSDRMKEKYVAVAERLLAEYEPKCDAPVTVGP